MKYLLFVLTLILCGCEGAYKNKNEDKNGNGFSVVLVDGCEYITSPYGLSHKGNCKYCLKRQNKFPKVDSIVFNYDSILVLHYNQSEVK